RSDTATLARRVASAADSRIDDTFLLMARTDIRGIDGLSAAVDRVKAMVDAGADAIFPEAMKDLSEFEAITNAVDVPVLANMTELVNPNCSTANNWPTLG